MLNQDPRMRADAVRNREALLSSGREVFRAAGADASVDEVARRAGVGKGTLYRHFPTKDHLIAAILQEHFDHLVARARLLASNPDPQQAVATWVREFDRGPAHFPGLRERMAAVFADNSSEISRACQPMKQAFGLLFRRAQQTGTIRQDVGSDDLLRLVAALPHTGRDSDDASPLLDVVLRGIADQRAAPSTRKPKRSGPGAEH